MNKKLTIVCCYNNLEMYKNTLVNSLKKQTFQDFNLVGINNTNNFYRNAASALNWAIENTNSDAILIIHQDFEFTKSYELEKLYMAIINYGDKNIIGVAGAIIDEKASLIKKIVNRNRKNISSLGEIYEWKYESKLMSVDSIDECCFGFKKELWNTHKFDSDLCSAWDLYAVEMCLHTRYAGGNAYVIPIHAIHHSYGNITKQFYCSLLKIAKAYKGKISPIVSTCIVIKTESSMATYLKLIVINRIKSFINKVFGKSKW